MRPLFLLAVALLAAAALPGCTQTADDPESSTSATSTSGAPPSRSGTTSAGTGSPASSGTGSGTSSSQPGGNQGSPATPNRAPTGTLELQLNGTVATFNLTGSDADNDTLSWTLSFGDNSTNATGTRLPATVNHTYAAGAFVAVLNLTDGSLSKAYSVNVSVAAAPAAVEPVVFTGSALVPDPFVVAPGGTCIMALADFMGSGTFGNLHGLPGPVEPTWTFTVTPAAGRATFISSDGGTIGGNGNSGTVGAGVSQVLVCTTEPDIDYTLTLTPA